MIKLFGTTIRETSWALSGAHLGKPKGGEATPAAEDRTKAIVRIVISLVLLFAAIFFVGFNKGNSQTVGGSILGALTGYWLK